jgi:hypothetical protein
LDGSFIDLSIHQTELCYNPNQVYPQILTNH